MYGEKPFLSVLGSLWYGKALPFGFGITLVQKTPSFRFRDHFGTEKPRFGFGITLVRKSPVSVTGSLWYEKAPFRFWDHFGTEKPRFGFGITLVRKKILRNGFGITLVRKTPFRFRNNLVRKKAYPKRIHSASSKEVTTCAFDTYHTNVKVPHDS